MTYRRDYTKEFEKLNGAAMVPAVSSIYAKFISKPEELVQDDVIPEFPGGVRSLNFLDSEGEPLIKWKWALYSAGHAILDIEKSKEAESMILCRNREIDKNWNGGGHKENHKNSLVISDSSGFQIINKRGHASKYIVSPGKNDDIKKVITARDEYRMAILKWSEATADLAMTLDIPTLAVTLGTVNSIEDALKLTMENHEFFLKYRTPEKTRWMNILQGRTHREADIWWDAVKDLPFEGWGMGGANASDMSIILRRMIMMRDGKYFSQHKNSWAPRNHIHFLGITSLKSSYAFTILQDSLRQLDPSITVTYDAASSMMSVAHGRILTQSNTNGNKTGYVYDRGFDSKNYMGSNLAFPWDDTPVGQHLTMGTICPRGHGILNRMGKPAKSSWTSMSYVALMAHNFCLTIQSIIRVNRLLRMYQLDRSYGRMAQWIPKDIMEFEGLVPEIFKSEKPNDLILKYRGLLETITGRNMGKGVANFDSLFSTDSEGFDLASDGEFNIMSGEDELDNID